MSRPRSATRMGSLVVGSLEAIDYANEVDDGTIIVAVIAVLVEVIIGAFVTSRARLVNITAS